MNTANPDCSPFATVVLLTISASGISGALAFAATQLGLPITAWVLWSVNVFGLVLLLGLGIAALIRAVFNAIQNGFSTSSSALRQRRKVCAPAMPAHVASY